jgi:hypothetical protein
LGKRGVHDGLDDLGVEFSLQEGAIVRLCPLKSASMTKLDIEANVLGGSVFTTRRALALATVSISAVLLTACSSVSTLNTEEIQTGISQGLTEQLGGTYTVTCPSSIEAKSGATFDCDIVTATGATGVVTATQTDDKGNITWEITKSDSPEPAPSES